VSFCVCDTDTSVFLCVCVCVPDHPCWQVLFSILDDEEGGKTLDTATSGRVAKRANPLAGVPLFHRTCWFVEGVIKGVLGPAADAPDKPNALKIKDHRNPGFEKCFHMSDKVCLADIKVIKNKFQALGVSINDVFAALLTMTLKRYFEEVGDPIAAQSVRASFPVNMRTSSDNAHTSFGNRIGKYCCAAAALALPRLLRCVARHT
jgi:hypothetical protein